MTDLGGKHLQLPQLSQLSFMYAIKPIIAWPAMPQLAELSVTHCEEVTTVAGLSALTRLTSLTLDWKGQLWRSCHRLLLAAPPSVSHIHLQGSSSNEGGWSPVPAMVSMPQLRSLTCRSPAIIEDLGLLTQLQHLSFPGHPVTALSLEQLDLLYRLTTLRRLEFGVPVPERAHGHRVQVVRKVLPAGCTLEQPMR
ncbi:hypothetical protein N2152v2_009671 [Parachlorella kessleri]